jgi:hypothetical protein
LATNSVSKPCLLTAKPAYPAPAAKRITKESRYDQKPSRGLGRRFHLLYDYVSGIRYRVTIKIDGHLPDYEITRISCDCSGGG